MAILDKLMEKKDLMAYISFRTKRLKELSNGVRNSGQKKERKSKMRVYIKERVDELTMLKVLISQNKLKEESIRISESLYNYSERPCDCCNKTKTRHEDNDGKGVKSSRS